tara:strand:+ start:5 stop:559 length:555 start_codon:yes stop_codon:yes gene_type:complete
MSEEHCIICIKHNLSEENELYPGLIQENVEYTEKNVNCWNCTYPFNMRDLKHIPLKYHLGKFYVTGYFCSNGCCLRYIYDTFKNKELWDKYELFLFYYQKLYNKSLDITIPPNKLLLEKFGGNINIESYRCGNNYSEVNIPPIVTIYPKLLSEKIDNKEDNKNNLKLFRKKTKKSTILNNMDIK